jgi:hypothetical protein
VRNDNINYFRKIADDIERVHYFKEAYLEKKVFVYVELRSAIECPIDFKKAFKKFRENYLRKIGFAICGTMEHQTSRPWNYHAHLVICADLLEIDPKELQKQWKRAGGSSVRIDAPWPHNRYRKLFYSLKAYKQGCLKVKSHRKDHPICNLLYCNLGPKKPWQGKPMPSKHFYHTKLKNIVIEYFQQSDIPIDIDSIFTSEDGAP